MRTKHVIRESPTVNFDPLRCRGYRVTLRMSEQPAPAAVPDEGIKEKDPILVEINKKIETAFDIFDHESNKTVDVR